MRKGKTIVITASLILAAVIAGCSSNNEKEPAASPSNAASNSNSGVASSTNNEVAAPVELNISFMGIQDGFDAQGAKEDVIFNDLQKKFNLTINPVQVTWNDWQEKAKVWAASGQLPDIFPNAIAVESPALYASWAKQGVIKALPDDLSKYPNLARIMELPSIQPLKVDGKFYTVPRMTYNDSSDWILDRPILYRKDWAAQAGFTSEPQSFDEFVAMVKAVQKQHPGTAGISLMNKDYLLTLFLPTFPDMSNKGSWTNENGKWVPSYASSKINEGIKQLRQLYSEGLLDKDFAIQKEADGFVKFTNGQAFISLGAAFGKANIETFNNTNPGVAFADAVGIMNIWPAADGNRYTFANTPFWSETYFSNKMDDEKFDRALQLMDYMSSEEYSSLAVNGILDTDYKMEGDKAVSLLKGDETLQKKYPVNTAIALLAQWHGAFNKAGKGVVDSNPEVAAWIAYNNDTFVKFKQEDKPAPINFDIMLMSTPAKDKLSVNVMDDLVKVILEKGDPIELWKATVKGYDAKGLQEAIAEVNAKAEELGIK